MATLFNTRISDTYQGLIKTLDNGVLGAALTQLSDGSGNGTGVFLNTSGDLEATGIVSFGSLKDIGENITISKFVDAADGLINNDNDTTIPTSAAIIDYVAGQVTLSDLDFSGDGGTTGSVDLDSQVFNVLGTANQITTSGSGQTLTVGLPNSVTISGAFTATTFLGDLNGTINTATTAVTQPLGDNSTKIATTAFVDRVITAQDLDFQGTTGSGSVDLDSQVLIIKGTTNEITTVGGAQTLTIGLPSSITTNLVGNVTGNVTGNLTGDVTGDLTGNVVGNLTGNTTGLHTGNVVGNVTGDLSGDVTGNVTGNVVGDLTGNVTGNVVGNVTGDLTGNADTATAWANGRTITLTGEATGITPSIDGTTSVSAALTLTNSAVIGKILTGLQSPAGATILATDSMLLAFGKLQSQINGIAEGLQFQGSWNASTNTPTLTSGVGTQGHYYIVSVAGSTDLDGITDWEVGDWAIYSTTSVWQRLDQTGVQGTGTTGNLTKWATGSTISDSIVSESGTALTVTGSLTTTLATTVSGNLTVGTDSLIVNSVSDAVSMAGILTVASPVINTGISGSAVLDDDTFATANATTVATTESIKAYVDSNTGSGTAGTIPKWASGGESLEDSIITESASAITVGGDATFTKDQNADTSIKLFNPNIGTSTEATIYVTNSSANADGLFLGTLGINTPTAGGFVQDGSVIGSGSGASGGLSIMTRSASDIRFYTNGHTNERMRITSGGTISLNVMSTADVEGYVKMGRSDGNTSRYNQIKNKVSGTQANNFMKLSVHNGTENSTTDALTILGNGNVGIGVTPIAKLHIQGTNSSSGGIKIKNSGGNPYAIYSDNNDLLFTNGDGTSTALTISYLGNVGIGDPPPTSPNGADKYLSIGGNIQDASIILKDATETWEIYQNNDLSFSYGTTPTTVLTLQRSTGNVGIGVTPNAPSNGIIQLDVGDNGCGMTSRQNNELIIQANANYSTYAQAGKPATRLNLTNDGEFHFLNAPAGTTIGDPITFTERMRISSGGNVGIGLASDGSTLFINGDLKTRLESTYQMGLHNKFVSTFITSTVLGRTTANSVSCVELIYDIAGSEAFEIRRNYFQSELKFTRQTTGVIGGAIATDLTIKANGTIFISNLGGYASSNADVRFDTSSKELYYQTSSIRYKKDVVNLDNSLSKITSLRAVRFKDKNTNKNACGLIAEETVQIIPEVVFTKKIEGFEKPQVEGINYSDIVPFLIKAIQEQQTIIDTLTARLDVLEKKA